MSVSRKMLSNDKISTGVGDRLYSSYNVVALNPKRFHILSLGRKLINGSCLEISIIDPSVEKLGFYSEWIIYFSKMTFFNIHPFNFIMQTFCFVGTLWNNILNESIFISNLFCEIEC